MSDDWLEDDNKTRIYTLRELDNLRRDGLTRGKLVDFHSRYKLILLAHSQPEYRQIGPLWQPSPTGLRWTLSLTPIVSVW